METLIEYEKTAYEGGATRSPMQDRYDLLPHSGLEAAARRFGYGAVRHGDRNWEGGGPAFAEACVNHLVKHVSLFNQYRKQEDLDALICNGMMIAEFKRKGLLQEKTPE